MFLVTGCGVLIGLIALGNAVFAATTPDTQQRLTVGIKSAPPFVIQGSGGDMAGISIDLWRQIADELDLDYEYQEQDLKGLLNGAASGDLDVALGGTTKVSVRETLRAIDMS